MDSAKSKVISRALFCVASVLLCRLVVACTPAGDPVTPADASTGTGGTGGSAVVGCDELPGLLKTHCAGGTCHNPGVSIPGLDLITAGGLETRLIGVDAHETCPNGQSKIVNTTKPASGVLFERVLRGKDCYKAMPPLDSANPPVPANFAECLTNWVTSKLK